MIPSFLILIQIIAFDIRENMNILYFSHFQKTSILTETHIGTFYQFLDLFFNSESPFWFGSLL